MAADDMVADDRAADDRAADDRAAPESNVDDLWGEWRGHDAGPDAVEAAPTRLSAALLEDGAALSRGAVDDPDTA
jgi:hypothetical protein